jgi:CBS domain containing-hemolysin-like protein
LVLDQLGQIPGGGETFALEGYQFEVVSMDGHRISRVRVRQNTASEMTLNVGQTSS